MMTSKELREHLDSGRLRWDKKKKRFVEVVSNSINARVHGAEKVVIDGRKFDSKLESYMYKLLTDHKINFEFQYRFILQPKSEFGSEAVRAVTWKCDFWLSDNKIIIDTKGYPTEIFKLKLKMFKYLVSVGTYDVNKIYLPSTRRECLDVVELLQAM